MGAWIESMAVIPQHMKPTTRQDCLDTWRKKGRICVPTRDNRIIDLIIVRIYETTAVNGLPLDLLIDARKTLNDPITQFGVIFSDTPPDRSKYDFPILWHHEGKGRWVTQA